MKALWKSLLKDKCRYRPIDEDERIALSHYSHLQRYFPALDHFRKESTSESQSLSQLELPSHYTIQQWISADSTDPRLRYWNVIRKASNGETEPCRAFIKVIHLIHPVDRLREKYTSVPHPLLPSSTTWVHTIHKIHRPFNQAYVDNVANYILSRIREKNLLPHGVLYYGSYTGISSSYSYSLTGEYDTYRNRAWFWKALQDNGARMTLIYRDPLLKEQTFFKQLYQDLTHPPPHHLDSSRSSSRSSTASNLSAVSDLSAISDNSDKKEEVSDSISALDYDAFKEYDIHDSSLEDPVEITDELDVPEAEPMDGSFSRRVDTDDESESDSHSHSESESLSDSWADSFDICLLTPNLPVSIIVQEAQEGVMDELLDLDSLDGHDIGSAEWEKRWIAWLFQVIAMLTFLQHTLSFTHNDLHTNNIVWRTTDKPYLYYRLKGKTIWRVPTYGKIFSLIDFGRATFQIGKHQWISDDFLPNEDAAGQYNYGSFYNPKDPKVEPNPSFDLCRLAVSLLSGLFEEPPSKKKGKNVKPMSEEGSWIVYETVSPLYNLLWRWTVDDAGKTIYENRHGEERYDGFDLYIHIAKYVHSAIPNEQLHLPVFQHFVWKQPIPTNETVYCLNG